MTSLRAQNPLHERYASAQMMEIFSVARRYRVWRDVWLALASSQRELGLPITTQQIAALEAAADDIDFERVAELERQTRHDVVAHLRHYAELAGDAGGILHLGATSAFVTDNTDTILLREALKLLESRLARVAVELAAFAERTASTPTLAYTHFQPAQLTTVGKRACLWLQDIVEDLAELGQRIGRLRCRGAKGTTGTQASFLTLFDGDHDKVVELDRQVAERLGFNASWPVTGQTYPRKQDSQLLAALSGIGESCHKMGTDLRLLQGVGELSEPFGDAQVGSSAMAYKRNPIRAERMCGLSRRLLSDALNGPMNAATQWLERSLDDSSNRRLVLTDAFLCADAVLQLAGGIAGGLRVHEERVASRVALELPFMATETLLMEAVKKGGDRQELHERIRRYSLDAQARIAAGEPNTLLDSIAGDTDFGMSRDEIDRQVDPQAFTGRSEHQVRQYLSQVVEPALSGIEPTPLVEPKV
jgi:adenylosuccinate lyase